MGMGDPIQIDPELFLVGKEIPGNHKKQGHADPGRKQFLSHGKHNYTVTRTKKGIYNYDETGGWFFGGYGRILLRGMPGEKGLPPLKQYGELTRNGAVGR